MTRKTDKTPQPRAPKYRYGSDRKGVDGQCAFSAGGAGAVAC